MINNNKKPWRHHCNHLLNVDFEWEHEILSQADPVERAIKIEKPLVIRYRRNISAEKW